MANRKATSRPASESGARRVRAEQEPEYLLLEELVILLRFDVTAPKNPRMALWNWLKRQAVPVLRRGRTLLVDRAVLDVVLRENG